MSGIFGVFRRDGRPVEPADLSAMGAMLRHRGPDGLATWHQGPVGLGVQLFWTTPEARVEPAPCRSTEGGTTLVYDGRVDNREELAGALGLDRSRLAATGDGELLLAAWQRWGPSCVERVIGDFAFAVVDEREQRLTLVRDRMGVRPLYYHLSDRLCAFGTEIKPLLCLEEIPLDLDEQRIASHLLRTFWEVESTFYAAIRRLPPAHRLMVGRESVAMERYWQLDPTRNVVLSSDEEYAEGFRELFTGAVRARVRAPEPVGALLSGGLDSSSVACVARDVLREQGRPLLHTFSGVFDVASQCDERTYIDQVVAAGGMESHQVVVDRVTPLLDVDAVMWHMEEPFFGPHMSMDWLLFGAAHNAGVRVLLGGMDGDTTVGHGYAYQTELLRSGHPLAFIRLARAVASVVEVRPRELYWRRGVKPLVPRPMLRAWHSLRSRRQSDTLLDEEFARRVDHGRIHRRHMRVSPHSAREEHWRSLESFIIPQALESNNRAAAGRGVETRHPFWDTRLIEYCLALPADQKMREGVTRIVMRNAMRGILPDAVQQRRGKARLGDAFVQRFLQHEMGRVEEIAGRQGAADGYLDRRRLKLFADRLMSTGHRRWAHEVWSGVMLALGLEAMERLVREARAARDR